MINNLIKMNLSFLKRKRMSPNNLYFKILTQAIVQWTIYSSIKWVSNCFQVCKRIVRNCLDKFFFRVNMPWIVMKIIRRRSCRSIQQIILFLLIIILYRIIKVKSCSNKDIPIWNRVKGIGSCISKLCQLVSRHKKVMKNYYKASWIVKILKISRLNLYL